MLEDVTFGRMPVSIVTGVSPSTIGTWIGRFGLFSHRQQGTGHRLHYSFADALNLAAARVLHEEAGLTASRACQVMRGCSVWASLIHKPFHYEPITGTAEPLLTLTRAPDGQWTPELSTQATVRMTIALLPVYESVRSGVDRLLAQKSNERLAELLPKWDRWLAEHIRARRAQAKAR